MQVPAYASEDDPEKKDRALTALIPFLQARVRVRVGVRVRVRVRL